MILKLKEVKGNIFESNCDVLVNPVNCVGVMGKGLALQFRNKYPLNYYFYKEKCSQNEIKPGKGLLYKDVGKDEEPLIYNFPTKLHWKDSSKYEFIKLGMKDMIRKIINYSSTFTLSDVINDYSKEIIVIAMPRLGCGLGKLDWSEVKLIIEEEYNKCDEVCDYFNITLDLNIYYNG